MKFCDKHWEQLRQAIKDKGMWSLVSKSEGEAVQEIVNELHGRVHKYDPLMTAHTAIVAAALKDGGLYLLSTDEDGKAYCPLCEGDKQSEGLSTDWINGSTDDCLAYCKNHGLLNVN